MSLVVYSVTEINRYVKAVLTSDERLKFIRVKGEISNFKAGNNGHLYFSLKDSDSLISAVMFSNYARKLGFSPKNGDEVTVIASLDAYPARGTYQLMVFEMEEMGRGQILAELEKLKKKLASEGLFDESRKRPVTLYPKAVGVITAPNGAAVRDIVTNIRRRYPICDIYVFPSAVQGENAPKELLQAFIKSQEYDLDTLIIGRGGGASEDLGAFNDEQLVRAIGKSRMPVISAVGHEIDMTLVDFVADKRASTPTGAAELATVDRREIEQRFDYAVMEMKEAIGRKLDDMKEELAGEKQDLDEEMKEALSIRKERLKSIQEHLNALNPENVLKRGYSITRDGTGAILRSRADIRPGQVLVTSLKDGEIRSVVSEKENG